MSEVNNYIRQRREHITFYTTTQDVRAELLRSVAPGITQADMYPKVIGGRASRTAQLTTSDGFLCPCMSRASITIVRCWLHVLHPAAHPVGPPQHGPASARLPRVTRVCTARRCSRRLYCLGSPSVASSCVRLASSSMTRSTCSS